MSVTPRPYQLRAEEQIRAAWKCGARRILAVLPTGAGKTTIMSRLVHAATVGGKGRRVVVCAHRSELVDQLSRRLHLHDVPHGVVQAGRRGRGDAPVQVCSVQTLTAREQAPEGDMLLFDECVTGDTMLGRLRADEVQVGDQVPAWDGESVVWRRVVHASSRVAGRIVSLRVGAYQLHCSDNHPIWVEGRDYVRADEVRAGDLCRVWGGHEGLRPRKAGKDVQPSVRYVGPEEPTHALLCLRCGDGMDPGSRLAIDLQRRVQIEEELYDDGSHESSARVGADDGPQPDAESGDANEGVHRAPQHRAQAAGAGREWAADAGSSSSALGSAGQRVDGGEVGQHGQERPGEPSLLCDRHRAPRDEDSRRGRRPGTRRGGREGSGRAEGFLSTLARVDRVEVHERSSDAGFERLCPGGRVYNFEVEGAHTFFANGILTHNCHHVVASTWGSILAAYPRAEAVIGFTATPERGDGKGLSDAFQAMVTPVDVPELIDGGYLLPSDVWAPSETQKDLAADPVEIWHRLARGRRGVVFASTVKQAHELAEAFTRSGVRAAALDGKTGDQERADIIGNLGRGALDIVCNVAVLTEGFDCPGLDVVMSAGGISSASAWIQKVGRGKRPKNGMAAPGERGLVIDLRGAIWEHGHPDEARVYSLAGKAISLGVERLPLRQCKRCGIIERAREGACVCGAKLPPVPAPKLSKAELAKIEAEKIAKRRSTPGTGARWDAWCGIVLKAREKNRTGLALKMEFRERFGHMPPWGEEAVPSAYD